VDFRFLFKKKSYLVFFFKLISKTGAIIYEMLTGLPPFYTTNREELFEKIKFGSLKFPSSFSPAVKNLLEGLFQKNPDKRLGSGKDDAKLIKEHPWFAPVNWTALFNKEIKPPFIPLIKTDDDISHFDPVIFVRYYKKSMGIRNSLSNRLNL